MDLHWAHDLIEEKTELSFSVALDSRSSVVAEENFRTEKNVSLDLYGIFVPTLFFKYCLKKTFYGVSSFFFIDQQRLYFFSH